jgi:hypothetical protein
LGHSNRLTTSPLLYVVGEWKVFGPVAKQGSDGSTGHSCNHPLDDATGILATARTW